MSADDADYLDALLARQHAILTGVADALRGDPGPLASHSHHDLAERAAATVAEVETLRRTLALAQESLAAAVRDERVTVVDEVARLQRERDEARADAAALRAAARAYLGAQDSGDRALDSWLRADDTDRDADAAQAASRWRTTQARIALRAAIDGATMRRDRIAEAVVSCPACGAASGERRGLRDAAREMLAAIEAPAPVWDADESEHDEHAARLTQALDAVRALIAGSDAAGDATMRRDLPAEAVVSCPACGYGITADLDDGVYVTRRHSRREPARVGAGEIVWCDGGIVRP